MKYFTDNIASKMKSIDSKLQFDCQRSDSHIALVDDWTFFVKRSL